MAGRYNADARSSLPVEDWMPKVKCSESSLGMFDQYSRCFKFNMAINLTPSLLVRD